MTDEQLQQQFMAELKELEISGAGLPFVFSASEAFMLMAQLQLVLRHPQNTGAGADYIHGLAKNIESRLCTSDRPAMQEIARRGWLELMQDPEASYSTRKAVSETELH